MGLARMTKAKEKKQWTMPEWMEFYRESIVYGERAEELYNDDGTNSNIFNNAPRALICVSLKSQIDLLYRLHERGLSF